MNIDLPMYDDDWEDTDQQWFLSAIDEYKRKMYPQFTPEIIYGFEKEYYLPALKALYIMPDGKWISPSKASEWVNGELKATCYKDLSMVIVMGGNLKGDYNGHKNIPGENCDCGIYGSVNMQEIRSYLFESPRIAYVNHPLSIGQDEAFIRRENMVLCVVEPYPDAKVILSRKGWRASHVFISEVVEKTIGIDDASRLLSMAWHRPIDVRRAYANR